MVTHHYLVEGQNESPEKEEEEAENANPMAKTVVQFDLAQQRQRLGTGKKRLQPANKNESQIKEVFQWDGEDLGFTKRAQQEQLKSHCSKKFQSEQRDQFRWFVEENKDKDADDLVNDEGQL